MKQGISVDYGMRGWFALHHDEEGPIATGIGSYETREEAIEEAQQWAKQENIPLDPTLVNEKQQTKQNMSEFKPVPIKRIKSEDFADGDNVKCVSGTLTKLYPETSGGDWAYQNGELKDSDGDTIKIVFSKCSQPNTAKGKKITILSVKNAQHGWLGIKVSDDSYKNKEGKQIEERVIKIVPSAEITYDGGAPSESSEPAERGSKPRPATESKAPNTHPAIVLKDNILLHTKIVDQVKEVYKEMPPEFQQSAVATLFIEACKQGVAFDFSNRILTPEPPPPSKYPPAPKDPRDWKQCVLPKGELAGKTLEELSDENLKKLHEALDKAGSNTNFAECVYQAAKDRKIFPKQEDERPAEEKALDPTEPEDDIPF